MTYLDQAKQIAVESDIAVLVGLNPDNQDVEFTMVRPQLQTTHTPKAEYVARRLRPVGIVGLKGLTPMSAFREPLGMDTVNRLASAFLEYCRVLLGGSLSAMVEVAELNRLWNVPDTRN
ncbi:MAG: hypothetical protein WBX09_15005 [Terracidiphilus sp.]